MVVEALKRSMFGIGYASIFTFISVTIMMINDINPPIYTIWLSMLGGFVLGIYFGLASFIFEYEKWSPLIKTMIHFCLSIILYFAISLPIGWIPLDFQIIILSIIAFIIIYAIFWTGYTLYFKRIEATLNANLQNNMDNDSE